MNSKKEIKQTYKQMEFPSGIYQIKNLANGKIFIGTSNNVDNVWNGARFRLNASRHPNQALQKDWDALGEENFEFSVLDLLKTKQGEKEEKALKTLEDIWLDNLKPFGDKGYNQ